MKMRSTMVLAAACALAAAGATDATAQEDRPGLERFAWLVGSWVGEGWVVAQDGRRYDFIQREEIRWVAGRRAILIEGTGVTPALGDEPSHEAMALMSHNPASGRYSMRAYRAEGRALQEVEATVTPQGEGFAWGFTPPGGPELRFTILRTPDGEWHEVGEVATGPDTWYRFLEMRLSRIP